MGFSTEGRVVEPPYIIILHPFRHFEIQLFPETLSGDTLQGKAGRGPVRRLLNRKLIPRSSPASPQAADADADDADDTIAQMAASKSHVISGCYERFVLGHQAVVRDGGEGNAEDDAAPRSSSPACSWNQRFAVKAHSGPVKCLAVRGGLIASGGDDDCVRIYDLVNGKDLGTLVEHEGSVTCLDMFMPTASTRPTHLFSGGVDGLINIWRVKDFKIMSKLRGHKGGLKSIAVHSSGKLALSMDAETNLCMWNLIKGRLTYRNRLNTQIEDILLSRVDNKYCCRAKNAVFVRNLERPEVNAELRVTAASKSAQVLSMCYPGANYVLAGNSEGKVCCFDLRAKAKAFEVRAHGRRVKGLAVPGDLQLGLGSAEGGEAPTCFVSASSEGDLKLWDARKMATEGGAEDLASALGVRQLGVRVTCLCAKEAPTFSGAEDDDEDEKEKEEEGGEEEEEERQEKRIRTTAVSNKAIKKKKKKASQSKKLNLDRFD